MKKRILISIQVSMGVRNFLCGPVFEELSKDWDIVVFTPFAHDNNFTDDFNSNYYRLNSDRPRGLRGPLARWIYKLEYLELWRRFKPSTIKKFIERESLHSPFALRFKMMLLASIGRWLFKNFSIVKDLIYGVKFPDSWGKIDAVMVLTTDSIMDRKIWYSAKKNRMPVVVIPHSWDNLPGRGVFPTSCDKLLVWNEAMKNQAHQFHEQSFTKVDVIGVPQYLLYEQIGTYSNQEQLQRLKIKPHQKYVVYTCNSKMVVPDEEEFIEKLLQDFFNQKSDLFLVLRTHPQDRVKTYTEKYSNHSKVILDVAGDLFSADKASPRKDSASIKNFNSLIAHAQCVIQYFSTTAIDASLWGTPTISPNFNFKYATQNWNSAVRWSETNHFSHLIKNELIPVANTFEELYDFIEQSLVDRDQLSLRSKKLKENQIPTMNPWLAIANSLKDI